MLGQTRDLAAAFFLEKQLSKLREDIMYNTIQGKPFAADEITQYENEIMGALKQTYYKMDLERLLHQDPQENTDAAFDQRTQKTSEAVLWKTHHILKNIPFVGQTAYQDE